MSDEQVMLIALGVISIRADVILDALSHTFWRIVCHWRHNRKCRPYMMAHPIEVQKRKS